MKLLNNLTSTRVGYKVRRPCFCFSSSVCFSPFTKSLAAAASASPLRFDDARWVALDCPLFRLSAELTFDKRGSNPKILSPLSPPHFDKTPSLSRHLGSRRVGGLTSLRKDRNNSQEDTNWRLNRFSSHALTLQDSIVCIGTIPLSLLERRFLSYRPCWGARNSPSLRFASLPSSHPSHSFRSLLSLKNHGHTRKGTEQHSLELVQRPVAAQEFLGTLRNFVHNFPYLLLSFASRLLLPLLYLLHFPRPHPHRIPTVVLERRLRFLSQDELLTLVALFQAAIFTYFGSFALGFDGSYLGSLQALPTWNKYFNNP